MGLKRICFFLASLIVAPCALMSGLERRFAGHREDVFLFWGQALSMIPGLPGNYLRRAYYRWTLDDCVADFQIGFGSYFTHRSAIVEERVYIGAYAMIGSARLRRNCMIGSHSSLLSGPWLHLLDDNGDWTATHSARLQQIEIGEGAWLGERSIAMADVGTGAMVAAGAVISQAVPDRVMMAGNPARFVRQLVTPRDASLEDNAPETSANGAAASRATQRSGV